jgi:hypothetical protein
MGGPGSGGSWLMSNVSVNFPKPEKKLKTMGELMI